MKLVSWNVNGVRAVLKKGFPDFALVEKPDVLCLQEIKAHKEQVGEILPQYPFQFWNSAEKKGYSGTAVFSLHKPVSVSYGLGKKEHDNEGRVITIELERYYIVNVYTPNSKRELLRLSYRQQWDQDFLAYVKKLEETKPVIVCGDLNVAHTPIDLANPEENYNKTPGYTQAEIDGFQRMLGSGFIDTFREFTKEKGHYSWWGAWNNLRARNIGWRIDYFLASQSLRTSVEKSFILPTVMGSDHCPVGMVIKS